MESNGRFGRALDHMSMMGLPGLAAGLVLAIWVPRLKPLANLPILWAGFQLVGAIVVLASLYAVAGGGIARHLAQSHGPAAKYDFGWAPGMTIGPWTSALAAASGAVAVQSYYWSPLLPLLGFTGPINAQRGFDIVNAYSLAFFDRYLEGSPAALLDGPAKQYPEVLFEKRQS